MTKEIIIQNKMDYLEKVREFREISLSSKRRLSEGSEMVVLSQGQTLLLANRIGTHAFIVVEGTLRLLAKEPFSSDLFSVGRADAGQLVGVVGLMRQSACEGAIARQPTKLLAIPLELLLEVMREDTGLQDGLKSHWSPCEGVDVLSKHLQGLSNPPKKACEWLTQQLKSSSPNAVTSKETKELLSSLVEEQSQYIGCEISDEIRDRLEKQSVLPVRFWKWNPTSEKDPGKINTVRVDKETSAEIENLSLIHI